MHSPEGLLILSKKPVRSIADLKGLKIRAASRSGVWTLDALGARGIGLPLNEIPPALSKRVIDADSRRNIARMAGENWVAIEGPAKKVMQSKSKNQFHVLPLAEVAKMQEAVKPVYARWFEEMKQLGIDGPRLLADARALIDKHSK